MTRYYRGRPVQGRKLALEAGAPREYPNGQRPQGRTLAAALHTNAYLESNPMMAGRVEEVVGVREGKRPPLIAAPKRRKRPR